VFAVNVYPADVMEGDGITRLRLAEQANAAFRRLAHVRRDAPYNGKDKGSAGIELHLRWTTQVVKPPPRRVLVAADVEPTPRPAVTVLLRRWVVERTLAWARRYRRLSERLRVSPGE
jgi:hypothetical protein